MAIQVNLEDHTGNINRQAKISDIAEIRQLIPAIVSALRLPLTDDAGHPIAYGLSHNGRRLQEDETLASAGVQEGDLLVIEYEIVDSEAPQISDPFSILKGGKINLGSHLTAETLKALNLFATGQFDNDMTDAASMTPESIPPGFALQHSFRAHKRAITDLAWSPSGTLLASSASDGTICIWNVSSKRLLRTLVGHRKASASVAWSPGGELLASGSTDQSIRLWRTSSGECLSTLVADVGSGSGNTPMRIGLDLKSVTRASQLLKEPDEGVPINIAWSPNGSLLAATAEENILFWDTTSKQRISILTGHTNNVNGISWSPDGKRLASFSSDQSIIIWDVQTLQPYQALTGHSGDINSIAWSPRGTMLASCSNDYTIRIWNPEHGQQQRILEGHTSMVVCVSFSHDERILASQDADGTILLWRTDTWQQVIEQFHGSPPNGWTASIAFHPNAPLLAMIYKQAIQVWNLDLNMLAAIEPSPSEPTMSSIQYTSAKIVLVGNSAVGKSGLSLVLTDRPYTPIDSTISCELSIFEKKTMQIDEVRQELREAFLWDLAGQPVYRLIHQLRLNKTVLAMIVFDGQSDTDPFAGVHYWDRALRQAKSVQGDSALPLKKFLVAGRIDSSGIGVSEKRIERLRNELGIERFFRTSAKSREGIEELAAAIRENIEWESLPKVSSTLLFKEMREFLTELRDQGQVLLGIDDLLQKFIQAHTNSYTQDDQYRKDLVACIDSAESQDLIHKLSFGDLVLLRPELRDAYAFALINSVKEQPDGFGCIAERQVLQGEFPIDPKWRVSNKADERLLLIAMIEELVQYEIALREDTDEGPQLVFPSQCTDEYPDMPELKGKTITFHFEGPIFNTYATLVVRLSYSGRFQKVDLWKDAATYRGLTGGTCGIFLENKGEGRAILTLFFDERASEETRYYFEEYIRSHLERRALKESIRRERIFACPRCNEPLSLRVVQNRRARELDWAECPSCAEDGETTVRVRISLLDGEDRLKVIRPIEEVLKDMHNEADSQREQQELAVMLQGKIAAGAFDVFLCHNGEDKAQVKEIGEQLKKLGILPWLDEWEIAPGTPWQPALEKQIDKVKSAAVFVGKNEVGPWQEFEIRALLSTFVKNKCPVIPVILPDVSMAEKPPPLPVFLQQMTWVDFRKTDPDPLKRLYWGITGKKL